MPDKIKNNNDQKEQVTSGTSKDKKRWAERRRQVWNLTPTLGKWPQKTPGPASEVCAGSSSQESGRGPGAPGKLEVDKS